MVWATIIYSVQRGDLRPVGLGFFLLTLLVGAGLANSYNEEFDDEEDEGW